MAFFVFRLAFGKMTSDDICWQLIAWKGPVLQEKALAAGKTFIQVTFCFGNFRTNRATLPELAQQLAEPSKVKLDLAKAYT